MTYIEREKIFSKECLNIEDLQELFDIDYNSASILMRDIKRKSDRLGSTDDIKFFCHCYKI